MTPDPGSLRSCAQVLETRAAELEGARTAVQGSLGRTTWVAASADRQGAQLAGVDARARTGVDDAGEALSDVGGAIGDGVSGAWDSVFG